MFGRRAGDLPWLPRLPDLLRGGAARHATLCVCCVLCVRVCVCVCVCVQLLLSVVYVLRVCTCMFLKLPRLPDILRGGDDDVQPAVRPMQTSQSGRALSREMGGGETSGADGDVSRGGADLYL